MDTASTGSANSKGSAKSGGNKSTNSKTSGNKVQSSNSNANSKSSETNLEEDCIQYAGTGTAITLGLSQSCACNDYVVKLEKDFNLLQEAFLELCTQLIRIQITVRQITSARPAELPLLLEDLQSMAFQPAKECKNDEELPNLMSDAVVLGSIQEKQHRLIVDVHNKFDECDFYRIQMEKYSPRRSSSKRNYNDDDSGNDNGSSNVNGKGSDIGSSNSNNNGNVNSNGNINNNINDNDKDNNNENNEDNWNKENRTYKMKSKKSKRHNTSQTEQQYP